MSQQQQQFKGNQEMLYYKDDKVRDKIDKLLKKNAELEATLGNNDTLKQKVAVKIKQERLFQKIKILDEEFYKVVQPYEDTDED